MNPLHFTHFDEYANAIRHVDLDVRLIHPRRQQHQWSLQETELESLRLHQARKCLQSRDPGQTTVAMVAAKNGFFDFGRFAAKYLQLFGEHPSVTLRRPN